MLLALDDFADGGGNHLGCWQQFHFDALFPLQAVDGFLAGLEGQVVVARLERLDARRKGAGVGAQMMQGAEALAAVG